MTIPSEEHLEAATSPTATVTDEERRERIALRASVSDLLDRNGE